MTEIILSLSGTMLLILLGVIGYFLKRLVLSIETLRMDFNEFSISFSVQENEIKNMKKSLDSKFAIIDKRLDRHSLRIDRLEK